MFSRVGTRDGLTDEKGSSTSAQRVEESHDRANGDPSNTEISSEPPFEPWLCCISLLGGLSL